MVTKKKKWPSYFPECCPPDEAIQQNIHVYRCAEHIPHTEEDFIPYYLKKNRFWREALSKEKLVQSCGLSCFKALNDAIKLQVKLPKFKCVISGNITEDAGLVMDTPNNGNTHITWWAYEGVEAHKLFKVYEEEENNGKG